MDNTTQRKSAYKWQQYFENEGYKVINPFQVIDALDVDFILTKDRNPMKEEYISANNDELKKCSHILMCKGWAYNDECMNEFMYSRTEGFEILYENDIERELYGESDKVKAETPKRKTRKK